MNKIKTFIFVLAFIALYYFFENVIFSDTYESYSGASIFFSIVILVLIYDWGRKDNQKKEEKSKDENSIDNFWKSSLYEAAEDLNKEEDLTKKKVSKPRKFKKGDLIVSGYDLSDEKGNVFKGIGRVMGVVKFTERKGKILKNIEYYEVKFGRKKTHLKVSSQNSLRLKKFNP
jgi:hypothetical protein